jgi:tetratricopeptide (TPR) repeat protein
MTNPKLRNRLLYQSRKQSFFKKPLKKISFWGRYTWNYVYNNFIIFSTLFISLILILAIVSFVSGENIFNIILFKDKFKQSNLEAINIIYFNISFLLIVIAITGIFPASYLAYLFYRRERSQVERTKNDLKLLGLVTENELKDFDRLYAKVYDPTQFLTFIFLLTAISTIILATYYNAQTAPEKLKLLDPTQAKIIFYAFLGAYLYGVRLIVRRYNTVDLQPQVYASIILRILVAGTIAFGLASLIEVYQGSPSLVPSPTNTSARSPSPSSTSVPISTITPDRSTVPTEDISTGKEATTQPDNQSNAIDENTVEKRILPWQILAFLIGVFPDQGLRWIVRLGKRAFQDPTLYQFNERSLRKIVGINEWHQARLEELGIDDAQSLATADICRLILTTQFDTMQVISWIDQAILHMKAGTKIDQFLAFQITTYHELYTLYTVLKKELGEIESIAKESSSKLISSSLRSLQMEEDKNGKPKLLELVQEIRNQLNKAPDKPDKTPAKDEYEKLLVTLGFLSLTELERLCDYSNYPNYIRIREYYKNLDNVVHEQSRYGTQEIIKGFSREIGGQVITPTRDTNEESLTPQEIEEREDKIRRLDSELQFGRPTAEMYTKKGLLNYEIGELDEALDAYNRAVEIATSFTGAYTGRSLVHIALGDRARNHGDWEKKQGDWEKKQGKENPAKQQKHDQEAQRYYEKAQRCYKEAQCCYGEAIYDNTVAISQDRTNAEAFNNLGLAYMVQDNFISALNNLETALQLNDRLATAYYNRGTVRNTIAKSQEDFIEATLDFERAYLLGYYPAALWATWGLALFNTGQYQQAVEKLTRAIALSNQNPALYLARRGFVYLAWGRKVDQEGLGSFPEYAKQASRDFERAIELSPDLAIAYVHYGELKTLVGDYCGAIEDYDKAIDLGFEDSTTYTKLANAHFRRGQSNEGEMSTEQGDTSGDYQKAIKYYQEAIKRGDRLPETYFNLADAYHRTGDQVNARRFAQKCQTLVKQYNNAGEEVRELENQINEFLDGLSQTEQIQHEEKE